MSDHLDPEGDDGLTDAERAELAARQAARRPSLAGRRGIRLRLDQSDPPLMFMSWANPILVAIRHERETTSEPARSIYVRWAGEIDRLMLHYSIPAGTRDRLRHARQVLARLIGAS